MSSFYFSDDLKTLLPLPLKPFHVLGAKFAVVGVSEYLSIAPFVLPGIIVFGVRSGAAWYFWPVSALVYLTLPIVPLVLSTTFVVVLMRVTNLSRNRDAYRVIAGLVGIAFWAGSQVFLSRIPAGNEEEYFRQILAEGGLVRMVGKRFPPSIWVAESMSDVGTWSGLRSLLYVLILSALALGALYLLAQGMFYQGLIGGNETNSRKRRTKVDMAAVSSQSSPVMTLFRREMKLFLRHPIFLMTGGMAVVLLPIILAFSLVMSGDQAGLEMVLANPAVMPYATVILIGLAIMSTGMNSIATTAISREGKQFWLSKSLPVSARQQVMAKLLHASALGGIGTVLMFAAAYLVARIPLPNIAFGIVVSLLGSIGSSALGVYTDLMRPNLKWTDPQKAMKGNNNNLIGMFLLAAVLGAGGFLAWTLFKMEVAVSIVYAAVFAYVVVFDIVSVQLLLRNSDASYEKILV